MINLNAETSRLTPSELDGANHPDSLGEFRPSEARPVMAPEQRAADAPTSPGIYAKTTGFKAILTPDQIIERLDQLVVGNWRAKVDLALTAYNHCTRVNPELGQHQIHGLLRKMFLIERSDSPEYEKFLDGLTNLTRGYQINKRSGRTFLRELRELLKKGRESELLLPQRRIANSTKFQNTVPIRGQAPTFPKAEDVQSQLIAMKYELKDQARAHHRISYRKDGLLILGESGSGKTLLVESLADILDFPFLAVDGSTLTEVGWEGASVSDIPEKLLKICGSRAALARGAIVLIDEIDKKRIDPLSHGRDISGAGVQGSLLSMIEGTFKDPEVDMSSVLIILAGSFSGSLGRRSLAEIVERRTGRAAGFLAIEKQRSDNNDPLKEATPEDLVDFGLMTELVGRLTITSTDPVTKEQLAEILDSSNSPLKIAAKRLERHGVKLKITPEAKDLILEQALKQKTGARALPKIINALTKQWELKAPNLKPDRNREPIIDTEHCIKVLNLQP